MDEFTMTSAAHLSFYTDDAFDLLHKTVLSLVRPPLAAAL